MKKFLLSGLLIGFLLLAAFISIPSAAWAKKPSDYHIGTSYAVATSSDKPAVVLVYADWCGYCKRYMPYFEKLYNQYYTKYNFSMVNGDTNAAVARQLKINGYPSVFIVDKKYKQQIYISYEYYLDNDAMTARLNKYLKRRQEWSKN